MAGLFINSMMLVFSAWVVLFFVFTGIGLFIQRLFSLRAQDIETFLASFWIGWAFSIFFLQLWHFLFRVNWCAFILISIIGIAGLFWNHKDIWEFARGRFSKNWPYVAILLLTALWLANRAILPSLNYDSGLYHLTSVRWAASFPIVPGLANLLAQLGFNSLYFLYVAMLNLEIGPWANKSHHFANGILLLVVFAQILLSISRRFKKDDKLPLYHIFNMILLAPVVKEMLGVNLSSPSPDLPIFVLGIVVSSQLLAFFEKSESISKRVGYTVFLIVTLIVLGITIKLSFFGLGIPILILTFVIWFIRRHNLNRLDNRKTLIWIIVVTSIVLIPWIIRNIILSGYIAYPISVGYFPVEWRIPHATLINTLNWIRGWTRVAGLHHRDVLGNCDWIRPWLANTFSISDVLIPLFLTFLGCSFMIFCRLVKRCSLEVRGIMWLFLVPPIISLMCWFFTAPDIRFVGSSFWILGAGCMSFGIGCISRLRFVVKLCIIFFIFGVLCFIGNRKNIQERSKLICFQQLGITKSWIIKPGKNRGFYYTPSVRLKRFITNSGLVVYFPSEGDRCWDAPLPCTPCPHPHLRLRREGDLRYGFIVEPRDEEDPGVGVRL